MRQHVQQEQELTIADARQARPEAAARALVVLVAHRVLVALDLAVVHVSSVPVCPNSIFSGSTEGVTDHQLSDGTRRLPQCQFIRLRVPGLQ